MIAAKDTDYFGLSGALMYDPSIGDSSLQGTTPTYQFVKNNNNYLGLNDTFMEQLAEVDASCGYSDYIDQYLVFPPTETQPTNSYSRDCDTGDMASEALLANNPCWNPYWTIQQCPLIYG